MSEWAYKSTEELIKSGMTGSPNGGGSSGSGRLSGGGINSGPWDGVLFLPLFRSHVIDGPRWIKVLVFLIGACLTAYAMRGQNFEAGPFLIGAVLGSGFFYIALGFASMLLDLALVVIKFLLGMAAVFGAIYVLIQVASWFSGSH